MSYIRVHRRDSLQPLLVNMAHVHAVHDIEGRAALVYRRPGYTCEKPVLLAETLDEVAELLGVEDGALRIVMHEPEPAVAAHVFAPEAAE